MSEGNAWLQDTVSISRRVWEMFKMPSNSFFTRKPAISSASAVAERRCCQDNHSSGPLIPQRLTIALQNHIRKGTVKITAFVSNTFKHLQKTLTFQISDFSKIEFARYTSSIKWKRSLSKRLKE